MDTTEREILAGLGISDSIVNGLDVFTSTQRPTDDEVFYDPTVCEPVTLTAGQVWSLRGALRFQMTEVYNALSLAAAGIYDGPERGWDEALGNLLGLDNLLAEMYAGCVAAGVEIPDYAPEG